MEAATGIGDSTLDGQKLEIDGTAVFHGNLDGSFATTYLSNGAEIEVGPDARLDLVDKQSFNALTTDTLIHVEPDGTIHRLNNGASPSQSQITVPIDNDGFIWNEMRSNRATPGLRLLGGSGGEISTGRFNTGPRTVLEIGGAGQALAEGAFFDGGGEFYVSSGTLSADDTIEVGGPGEPAPTRLALDHAILSNTGTFTVFGGLKYGEGSLIAGPGTTRIAPGGTLDNDGGDARYLDQGTLRIDGEAVFAGDQDNTFAGDDLWMSSGATLEIGSGGHLDLRRAQDLVWLGGDETSVHVLEGGELSKADGRSLNRISGEVDNQGTIDVGRGELQLEVDGVPATFVNYDATTATLDGGAYVVRNRATLSFPGAAIRDNAADLTLIGARSKIEDLSGTDALRPLRKNAAAGKLRLRNERDFAHRGSFSNNGLIDLDRQAEFRTTKGFTQGSEGSIATDVVGTGPAAEYGRVTVGGAAGLAGRLEVDSSAYTPQAGDSFDVLTAGTLSGAFGTVVAAGFDVAYLADRVRLTPH
jgi:hypothetical protein